MAGAVRLAAASVVGALGLLTLFLLREGAAVWVQVGPGHFLLGQEWAPLAAPPRLGIRPLLLGSALVGALAAVVAVGLGLLAAIYLAEEAPPRLAGLAAPLIALLAATPSVVMGFLGLQVVAPLVQRLGGAPTGQSALAAAVVVGVMALPTVVALGQDALRAVPMSLREASLALGADRLHTLTRAVLPAAAPGLAAAAVLGLGRVVGETMVVLMLAGNAPQAPASPLDPVATLPAVIAAEMGETVRGSTHQAALFAMGLVLLAVTWALYTVAGWLGLGGGGQGRP